MATRYVLLGDIVGSRAIDDREAFGSRLADACETVSDAHADGFAAPLEPLKGIDELGGVLADPAVLYDVLDALREHLHPQAARVAVAAGDVDVGADTGVVARMDGPAFHRADDLLADLAGSGLRVAFDLGVAPWDDALADEVNLLFLVKRAWTAEQRRAVAAYREHGSQAAAADALGISQSAVSQRLGAANWQVVREIETRLRRTLRAV